MVVKAFGVGRVLVVELGEVMPHHALLPVLAGGVGDAAIVLAHEPLWMLAREGRVNRAMVDDQINHQLQTGSASALDHVTALLIRRSGAAGVEEYRVDLAIVSDGIQAAGVAQLLDGIDEDPVKAHGGGTGEVLIPAGKRSCQQRKQVV